jgi:cell division protein FtsB
MVADGHNPTSRAQAASSSSSSSAVGVLPLIGAAVTYLSRPHEEVLAMIREASALRLFWYDMRLRPNATAHRTVMVSGLLLSLVTIVSLFVMEFDAFLGDHDAIHFVILERLIAGTAQALFSTRAICVENKPLLIIANCNAAGIVVRFAIKQMMFPTANWILLALTCVAFLVHLVASVISIRGGLSRFAIYMISSDTKILAMYRDFQGYTAIALLDLETAILSVASLFFFMEKRWYWYVLFVALIFASIANSSLLRHIIRTERQRTSLIVLIPIYLALPVGVIVATWYESWMSVDLPSDVEPPVIFSVATFTAVRILLLLCVAKCFSHFGKGLKEAFENSRDAVSFVREEAENKYSTNLEAFLSQADEVEQTQPRPLQYAGYGAVQLDGARGE